MAAIGLQTHIWDNNVKSIALLAAFPVLLAAIAFALTALMLGLGGEVDFAQGLAAAVRALPFTATAAFAAAGGWFAVAYFAHQGIIDAALGARQVARKDEPALYNLLENLCISRGLAVPSLRIIETPARNAFASGLREAEYTITVTRGLLDSLAPDEVEAVLAHELTHIENRDVRLLVVAAVFVGVIAFAGEMAFRVISRGAWGRTSRQRRSGGVNAGALILIALALLGLAYLFAMLTRFALSRRREYLADAGAVELTRNPDAMVRALEKIAGKAELEGAPSEIAEMFLEHRATGLAGLFATHPPIAARIAALRAFAGGQA